VAWRGHWLAALLMVAAPAMEVMAPLLRAVVRSNEIFAAPGR
jgi:hypothetical protein